MIELDGFPELVDPLLIAAFEGWNDAGDAATSAVEHLEQVWDAIPLTELDPEDYYDYQVNRPTCRQGDDGRRAGRPGPPPGCRTPGCPTSAATSC